MCGSCHFSGKIPLVDTHIIVIKDTLEDKKKSLNIGVRMLAIITKCQNFRQEPFPSLPEIAKTIGKTSHFLFGTQHA